MSVLPATVIGRNGDRPGRVVVVETPAGPVKVRWQLGRSVAYRCDACGPLAEASCAHTFAAGLALAEQVLGLTRTPDLIPDIEQENAA